MDFQVIRIQAILVIYLVDEIMKPPEHLLHSQDDDVGYRRRRVGKGFVYFDENGERVTEPEVIERLNRIGIPPAWQSVWICKQELGCLQASGRDQRGRKQYIYHPDWALYRNLDKFEHLYRFGEDLSRIRQQVKKDVNLPGWPKDKVLALAISVLDETYIRVGNPCYVQQNGTYGLTTLRRKHLEVVDDGRLVFSYRAKGGKYRKVALHNRKLNQLIRACAELPGYEVFRYVNEQGQTSPISSQDVNAYLESITGEHYTAKDFRTWGGSVTALEKLPQAQQMLAENPRLNLVTALVKLVSKVLGNTIAICRKYYIHPAILSAVEQQEIDWYWQQAQTVTDYPDLDETERTLMVLLRGYYQYGKTSDSYY
jgi:DNA topoisomerase-1